MPVTKVSTGDPSDQREALGVLAKLVDKAILDPKVRETALAITAKCGSRNDRCELQAIFDAVKHGTPEVQALRDGFRYVADPRSSDLFIAPGRSLDACEHGACGGDCDDHASLIAGLAGAIGFRVGLRAWGPPGGDSYIHVYAVAGFPKRAPTKALGMDTTVAESDLGWEPPNDGRTMTAWLE